MSIPARVLKDGTMAKATTVVNGLPKSGPSVRERHPHLCGTLGALLVVVSA
jgi:hypothetical protein